MAADSAGSTGITDELEQRYSIGVSRQFPAHKSREKSDVGSGKELERRSEFGGGAEDVPPGGIVAGDSRVSPRRMKGNEQLVGGEVIAEQEGKGQDGGGRVARNYPSLKD